MFIWGGVLAAESRIDLPGSVANKDRPASDDPYRKRSESGDIRNGQIQLRKDTYRKIEWLPPHAADPNTTWQ